jgi:hypothetical protein
MTNHRSKQWYHQIDQMQIEYIVVVASYWLILRCQVYHLLLYLLVNVRLYGVHQKDGNVAT